jgi:hypothetical protein
MMVPMKMWCYTFWYKFINVSEEHTTSIFKVEGQDMQSKEASKKQNLVVLLCDPASLHGFT